jgi:hypothetical protein
MTWMMTGVRVSGLFSGENSCYWDSEAIGRGISTRRRRETQRSAERVALKAENTVTDSENIFNSFDFMGLGEIFG